jgi:hypothetical protein
MKFKRPIWFGFFVAPLIIPLVYMVWALFFWNDPTPKQEFSDFTSYAVSAWVFVFSIVVSASYFVSAILGIPLFIVLKRLNKISFFWFVLLAALLGAGIFVGIFLLIMTFGAELRGNAWSEMARFLLTGGALGSMVAASFCMIVGITLESSGQQGPSR